MGVRGHRQHVAAGPAKPPPKADEKARFEGGWSSTPSLKNQMERGEDYWKTDKLETKVFDLSKPDDLTAYNELLSKVNKPDSSQFVVHTDRQFSANTGNWMILVEIQHILFRKVLITDENRNEKAGSD